MSRTILVVDDDPKIRQMLTINLTQEGYRVVTAVNGRDALFVARDEKPDVIILDLMMPEMGGYEFVRVYSKEADTPIIMLTAKVEESDKILGLELGADDYVTKPFSVKELTARIRAMFRRMDKFTTQSNTVQVSDIVLDPDRRLVTVAGSRVDLTPSEFEILAALMANPGRVFSRLDLIERMQGMALEGFERSIDVHVRNLRRKIEPDPGKPRYVETVYGMGYRFAIE
ncbi:MAG: DNA-binding response regulator [Chloroflexi bacterium]|nr:MAG: DNA-binding response regulator [Chloroflexota bacterium]